jgi:1-acyl-sn-glycerol-3-phosphate acyltransferase
MSSSTSEPAPATEPAGDRPSHEPSNKPVLTEDQLLRSDITPMIRSVAFATRAICRCFTRLRIEGDTAAIPRDGPVILAANHISNADAVLIGAFMTPRLGRRIHWLGKKEMFDWPVVGYIARNGGIIPVDRGAADVEAFRVARRVLDAGSVLMVFPEGTRSPTGQLQPPKDGLSMLALRTNATIVPIGISNTDRIWPKGRAYPLPGRHATMRIGEPFEVGDLLPPELDRKAAKGLATTLIMRRIAALLDRRHRGTYGEDG